MQGSVFYCIVLIAAARSSYGLCQFPPDLWCSTPEIAATCYVSNQCEGWNCIAKRHAKKVDVAIYYDSECPVCSDFINNSLAIAHKEVAEIMNLQLVPYGNVLEEPEGDSWNFTCVYGGIEQCKENILQACVIYFVSNISVQLPLIRCIMTSSGHRDVKIKLCALELGDIDWIEIIRCSRGFIGRELEHQMALKTTPFHEFREFDAPFMTVNGAVQWDIKGTSGPDLVKLICQTYQGPFTYGCRTVLSTTSQSCRTVKI